MTVQRDMFDGDPFAPEPIPAAPDPVARVDEPAPAGGDHDNVGGLHGEHHLARGGPGRQVSHAQR